MRKYHHQQILTVLQTIKEAQSSKLYAECQEGALSVCDFIESIAGKGTLTVTLLEEYCETLFKVNAGELDEKTLDSQFSKIEESVNNELPPTKIEMAFFPYKASTFGAMESIWRPFNDDPHCDAYVIPIPYYDRLPDGSLGEMHFEGSEYPKDIPVVDWEAYDVEVRHPDIIFLYHPYDDSNPSITVHPDFYSKNLENHTDVLRYTQGV
ncbi:MAG: hypothetical protein FWC91_09980 [Defluviitaleaceae bacterium]|nr:hypothetical protein [Defluviitaleaceae bacterium]